MSTTNPSSSKFGLALAALGVVYGDIGTSPLYAFRESLNAHGLTPTQANVMGVLSLIFWTLLVVVTIKYVWFVMRADNKGEGGILALLALALRPADLAPNTRKFLLTAGLIGASLFYGDGIITPAISVLSAVEGIEIATPLFKPYVIPITLLVLILLFVVQRRGAARVGSLFGPVMVLWFTVLATTGILQIIRYSHILAAVNPLYAVGFIFQQGYAAFITMGAVVLAVTGAEALYADMGHFGAQPIRRVWLCLVFPALVLNYFGQGAVVISHPETVTNPFYLMMPGWAQIPMIVLATLATIIASQAVISGTYSLTQQALQLGYLPRVEIVHTSASERGQIYLPGVNGALLIAIIALVLTFQSSSSLAAAYGIAVTGTMLMTTVLLYFVARRFWGWSIGKALFVTGVLIIIDAVFLGANSLKIVDGGWFPLAIGIIVYTVMSTWRKGRILLYKKLYPLRLTLEQLQLSLSQHPPQRVPGTAVYMAAPKEGIPHALMQNLKHTKVMHEQVIILTILVEDVPRAERARRYELQQLDRNFYHLTAHFGFMEFPDVPKLLEECKILGLDYQLSEISFFLSRLRVIPTEAPSIMAFWREKLFALMLRNTAHATDFFRIPSNQVMELDVRLEI